MRLQLTHALHRLMQQRPNAPATVFGTRRMNWQQLGRRVARLAAALRASGMRPGDRVGMLAVNSDRYLEYMLGVWWGGGVLNPVNTRWSAAEVAYSLDDCDTQILLVDRHFAAWHEELKSRSKSLRTLIYTDNGEPPAGLGDYETLLRDAEPVADCESGGEDLAGVFYTGGTTGFPKGVMLTHESLLSNAFGYLLDMNYDDDETILVAAPMFHQAGMCTVVRALLRASTCVIIEGFDAMQVLRAIEQERVGFTLLVPTMLQRLLDCPEFSRHDLSSLKRILYGASPIGESLLSRALESLPGVELSQGYGMTETSGPYTLLPARFHRLDEDSRNRQRLRSAGRAVWGMEVRVVGSDGAELPLGQTGEIVSRGAGVMQGYWNREQETAQALKGGWLYSGDMGYMDEDGLVYIVDRLKDMIVTGGENVYSAEVENALGSHAAVASCAVIAVPSERWGEAVHAVVVLRAGASANADELREHCKGQIAGYKCPRSVEFRDSLPLSGAGKLLKHVLREPYWQGHGRRIA